MDNRRAAQSGDGGARHKSTSGSSREGVPKCSSPTVTDRKVRAPQAPQPLHTHTHESEDIHAQQQAHSRERSFSGLPPARREDCLRGPFDSSPEPGVSGHSPQISQMAPAFRADSDWHTISREYLTDYVIAQLSGSCSPFLCLLVVVVRWRPSGSCSPLEGILPRTLAPVLGFSDAFTWASPNFPASSPPHPHTTHTHCSLLGYLILNI